MFPVRSHTEQSTGMGSVGVALVRELVITQCSGKMGRKKWCILLSMKAKCSRCRIAVGPESGHRWRHLRMEAGWANHGSHALAFFDAGDAVTLAT